MVCSQTCIVLMEAERAQPGWLERVAAMAAWLQGQPVGMAAWLREGTVGTPLEHVALQEMAALVVLGQERSALLAVLVAEVAQEVAPCRTLAPARATTSRKPPTSTSVWWRLRCGAAEERFHLHHLRC